MKIRNKFIIYFSILLLFQAVVIGSVTSKIISSTIERNINEMIHKSFEAAELQYYARAHQMRYGMLQAASQDEIKDAVFYKNREYLRELMKKWKIYRPYVDLWLFVDRNGLVMASLNEEIEEGSIFTLNNLLLKAVEEKDAVISTEVFNGNLMLSVVTPVIKNNEVVGAIITGDIIDNDSFIPESLEKNIPGIFVAVSRGERIVTSNLKNERSFFLPENIINKINLQSSFIGDIKIEEENYRVIAQPIKDNTGEVIGALIIGIPKKSMELLISENRNAILVVSLFSIFLAFIISLFLSFRISRPLSTLAKASEQIKNKNFEIKTEIKTGDEIEEFSKNFNLMAEELEKLYNNMEREIEIKTREIEEKKDFLYSLIENMKEGVIFLDNNGKVTLANNSAAKLRGFSKKEGIIGKDVLDCHPVEYRNKVIETLRDIKNGKSFAHRVVKINDRYIENSYTVLDSGIIVVSRDITDRIKLEKKMEEKNKELHILQEINNMINSDIALDEILRTLTSRLKESFNYDSVVVHLISRDRKKLILKSYSSDDRIVRKIEKITKTKAVNYETPLYEGSMITEFIKERKPLLTTDIEGLIKAHTTNKAIHKLAPIIAKISKIKFALGMPLIAGEEVVGVIGIGNKEKLDERDKERVLNFSRQVALAIRKAQIKKELEEYTELLQRSINEGVIITDEGDTITACNKKFCEIVGKDEKHIIGKKISEFLEIKNEKLYEVGIKNKVLLVSQSNFQNGKFYLITNITEKKKMEERMREAEKLITLGHLAAGIAHEINNPLGNIAIYLHLLEEKIKKEDIDEELEIIKREIKRAKKIIEDLLEFSKPKKLKIEKIDINKIIEDSLNLIKNMPPNTKIIKKFSSIEEIYGEKERLMQVFLNIIVNACQAMPNGGELKIETFKEDKKIKIKISDTGVGIPEEDINRIFEPFFTTKEPGKGSGLGLSVAMSIIKEHKGEIEVESKVNKGTTFTITLPLNYENFNS